MTTANLRDVRTLRRVVTGNDAEGRSSVSFDGSPGPVLEFFPGAGLFDVWADGAAYSNLQPDVAGKLLPPAGGVRCRWFTVLPVPPHVTSAELATFYDGAFQAMSEHDVRPDTARHPGMHRTETLDFFVVLQGRVRLILDKDDCVLETGDAVVQRGTNHAWACVGDVPAILFGVLIDKATGAKPSL